VTDVLGRPITVAYDLAEVWKDVQRQVEVEGTHDKSRRQARTRIYNVPFAKSSSTNSTDIGSIW